MTRQHLLLLLILRPLLVIFRFPIQLERAPYSSSLDLVRRSQTVRDRVDRGLDGSVNYHRRGGIEGGQCGSCFGDVRAVLDHRTRRSDERLSRARGEGGGDQGQCAQHVW